MGVLAKPTLFHRFPFIGLNIFYATDVSVQAKVSSSSLPGAEEGSYRSEGQDDGAHSHREASAGAHPPVSLLGHAPLRLSDAEQAAPHPG